MLEKGIKVIIVTILTCLDGLLFYIGMLWCISKLLFGHFYANTFIMILLFIRCLRTSCNLFKNITFKITKFTKQQ